jgi:hypothetical protein
MLLEMVEIAQNNSLFLENLLVDLHQSQVKIGNINQNDFVDPKQKLAF